MEIITHNACEAGGGMVEASSTSSTGLVCVGGDHDGQTVEKKAPAKPIAQQGDPLSHE